MSIAMIKDKVMKYLKMKIFYFLISFVLIIGITIFYPIYWMKFMQQPDEHDRKANLGMLVDAIRGLRKGVTNTDPYWSFENVKNKDHVPTISWRYRVLPLRTIRFADLDLSEPWNSRHNQYENEICFRGMNFTQLSKRSRPETKKEEETIIITNFDYGKYITYPFCYEYPNSHYKSTLDEKTNILTITGTGTISDPDVSRMDWVSLPDDLLVLVEVHSDIHWTEPCDIEIDDLLANNQSPRYEFGLQFDKKGFYICFLDTQTWYLDKDTPLELLGKLATVDGAKENDREELLKLYIIEKN
jgi:hypothetical protein